MRKMLAALLVSCAMLPSCSSWFYETVDANRWERLRRASHGSYHLHKAVLFGAAGHIHGHIEVMGSRIDVAVPVDATALTNEVLAEVRSGFNSGFRAGERAARESRVFVAPPAGKSITWLEAWARGHHVAIANALAKSGHEAFVQPPAGRGSN
jgi:hypothetical protein